MLGCIVVLLRFKVFGVTVIPKPVYVSCQLMILLLPPPQLASLLVLTKWLK